MSFNRPLAFQSLSWSHRARTAIRRAVRRRARDVREAYNETGTVAPGVIGRSMNNDDQKTESGRKKKNEPGGKTALTGSLDTGTGFSGVFARLSMPLTHPVNQCAWRGKMHAIMIAGPSEPSVTSCRWITRVAQRAMWKAMRVVKKENAKTASERRRGVMLPRARTNVGIWVEQPSENVA